MVAILLTAALLASAAYGVMIARGAAAGWPGAALKTGSVAGLALGGLAAGAPVWIVAGLALGSVGDFALTRSSQRAFLAGMAAFALGHLAYASGFWLRGQELVALGQAGPGLWGWLALVPLALLLGSTEVWLAPHTGALRGPVRAYVGVIGVMAATAVLLVAQDGDRTLQAGSGLFVLSDLVLAIRLFRAPGPDRARLLSLAVWPLYWLGQALILYGSLFYWSSPVG